MAWQAAGLIALALVAFSAQAAEKSPDKLKTPQTPFYALKPDERKVLTPVEKEWDRLPGYQQQRLVNSARKYPSMQPIQKERFDTRIRDWAAMTPQQRQQAREAFQGLRKLPPEKQHELRERWLQQHRSAEETSEQGFSQAPAPRR